MHTSAAQEVLCQQVMVTLTTPDWQAAWRPDLDWLLLDPPLQLLTDLIKSTGSTLPHSNLTCLRVCRSYSRLSAARQASSTPSSRLKFTYLSEWKSYKRWCLEECRHPWVSLDPNQVSANSAHDQPMHFLDYIKPSMQSYNHFCDHKSAIATAS